MCSETWNCQSRLVSNVEFRSDDKSFYDYCCRYHLCCGGGGFLGRMASLEVDCCAFLELWWFECDGLARQTVDL